MAGINNLIFNKATTENYLNLLDEGEEQFTFRAFDDNNERKSMALAKIWIGTLDQHYAEMVKYNKMGAGIFVNVQRTDQRGGGRNNIVGIRCIYHELDNGQIKKDPIEPSFIVKSSKGKMHKYWLCDDVSKDDFAGVMRRCVQDYGSDKNAQDVSRVLRLPGFYHMKDENNPQLVEVIHESGGQIYSRDAILRAFPPLAYKNSNGSSAGVPVNVSQQVINDLQSALLFISSDDRDVWISIGHALKELCEVGFGLWLNWSAKSAKFDIEGAYKTWDSFKPTNTSYQAVFKKARSLGWNNASVAPAAHVNPPPINPFESNENSVNVTFMDRIDKTHILNQLADNVAHVCYLPRHSVYLTAMGVFSSMACRKYKVKYKHGGSLPISLYVMAEQPSGAAKSRSLNLFQAPFRRARSEVEKIRQRKIEEIKSRGALDDDAKRDLEQLGEKPPPLFITNATPEALEQTLTPTGGYFAAVSSEKGLANAILGASYGDSSRANNNDVLLNGFDGGYVASIRVSRSGYEGHVVGSTVVIAQQGSIEKLLQASDGSGLAERFLLLSEGHYLGQRDFNDDRRLNRDLINKYNAVCVDLYDFIDDKITTYDDLIELTICDEGHDLIAEYRNRIEPELADGGKLSSVAIRGAAAKIDMQIMKTAANLYLMSGCNKVFNVIDAGCVRDGIIIANDMLRANLALCADKELNGTRAEYSSVLSLFEKNNAPRTERMILHSKRRTSPFKEMNFEPGMTRTKYIKNVLLKMVKDGMLITSVDGSGVTVYRSA